MNLSDEAKERIDRYLEERWKETLDRELGPAHRWKLTKFLGIALAGILAAVSATAALVIVTTVERVARSEARENFKSYAAEEVATILANRSDFATKVRGNLPVTFASGTDPYADQCDEEDELGTLVIVHKRKEFSERDISHFFYCGRLGHPGVPSWFKVDASKYEPEPRPQ